jgi:glycosyltransferase involved in cell wall biosynthesis
MVVQAEADLLRSGGHEVIEHRAHNPESKLAATGSLALAPWNPAGALRVRRLAERCRPDVAHVHNTWFAMSPAVVRALKEAGIPVVMTLHNYRLFCANGFLLRDGRPCELCVGRAPWNGLRYRCYRGSIGASAVAAATIAINSQLETWGNHVDIFLAQTEFAKRLFVAGGLPKSNIRVKPNFVADPGRRPVPPSASRQVLYVGRLSKEKGVQLLIEAWAATRPDNLELMVVGDGPLRSHLTARDVPGVRFAGVLERRAVLDLMHQARTLMLPSVWYEAGIPLVMLEAFASGLPVLASRLAGMEDSVSEFAPDFLVEPGDKGAWANAIEVLQDDSALDGIGAAARDTYRAAYTPQQGLLNLVAAYEAAGA